MVRARLHHRHRLHTLSGRHDLRSRDEGCFWSGTSGGLIFWRPWYTMPPLAEHVARTQLSIEHGVGFWFPQPMACNRTAHAHDQQPLLASLRIPRTWRDPCCRRQNRFQSLPRRPVDSGFGEIFGVRGPRPVVEDPEVKGQCVRAQGRSASGLGVPHALLPRADARSGLAVGQTGVVGRDAAHRTCSELDTTPAPGFLPGCRCGGHGDVPRAASLSASHALRWPTVSRSWRRVGWLQQELLGRIGRIASCRCR